MKENKNIDQLFEKLKHSEDEYFPNKEKIWDKIEQNLEEEQSTAPRINFKILAIAASVVILGVVGIMVWRYGDDMDNRISNSEPHLYVIQTEKKNLEDSLNGDSSNNLILAETEDPQEEAEAVRSEYSLDENAEIYAYEAPAEAKANSTYYQDKMERDDYLRMKKKEISSDTLSELYFKQEKARVEKISPQKNRMKQHVAEDELVGVEDVELMAEVAMTSPVQSEIDFYFVDGKKVTENELKKEKRINQNDIQYLSNESATKLGYISFYRNGLPSNEVENVVFWKEIKPEQIDKKNLNIVYSQLNNIQSRSLNLKEKKLLKELKGKIQKRIKASN